MKFKLDPNQLKASQFHLKLKWSYNCMEMGCIAGDTEVRVNLAGCSRKRTLSNLYNYYNKKCKDTSRLRIRSFIGDEKGIRLHTFSAVLHKGEKECITIKLEDGKSITLTPDHEVLTKLGFKRADSLSNTDEVMVDNLTRHQKKEGAKPRYNVVQVGEYYPYGHYVNSRSRRIKRTEIHILKATARLNSVSYDEIREATKKPDFMDKYKTINPETHQVHHIDHNPKNNEISNLKVMTKYEHSKLHGDYLSFGHSNIVFSKVKDISEAGVKEVFDIVCDEPHHNFVANNIVVHNCGKSITALETARISRAKSLLIFCPAYLIQNWKDEIKKFYDNDYPLAVEFTSYASRKGLKPSQFVIDDEVHYIKNFKAKRTERVYQYLKKHKPSYFIGLSGTPMTNSAWDFYPYFAILDLKHNIRFPKDPYAFQAVYCRRVENDFTPSGFSYEGINPDTKEELKELIRPWFYFTPSDLVPQLPPTIDRKYIAKMPISRNKLMEKALEEGRSQEFMAIKAMNAEYNTATTIKLIKDLIEEKKRPVVFTEHRASASIIAKHFGTRPIIGGVSDTIRHDLLEYFDKGITPLLVGTYGAMGTGLNITSSDTMILNDYPFRPSDYDQARKRIHRKGQSKTCFYHHVFSNDIDYQIFNRMMRKKGESDEMHQR